MASTDVPQIVVKSIQSLADADIPNADVVVATFWPTAEAVAELRRAKGAKAYFLQGYELHDGSHAKRLKATWGLPLHKIVVSRWLASIAEDEYGDTDYSLVPNAVDLELFHAPPRGKRALPTVGCVYATVRLKGVDIATEAVRLAQQERRDLRSNWFGWQPVAPELPLPQPSSYHQTPAQDCLRGIYGSCDAWLFPSRNEGFGLPILEAMACRTPVIATPAGAAPELVPDNGGMLVPAEDPDAMARAILDFCDMRTEDWRARSDAAYAAAAAYTWEDATDRFEAALKRAVEQQS